MTHASDAKDDGSGSILDQSTKADGKTFNMARVRASLLAPRDLEVIEIEIDDDDDDDSQGSFTKAGKFLLPKIPPFRGGRKSSIATAASEDTFEEIVEDDDDDEIEEEVIEDDDDEEIIEEVVDDDYVDEVVDDDAPSSPAAISRKVVLPPSVLRSPRQAVVVSKQDETKGDKDETEAGDEDDDDDDEDKPDEDEVREAIRYILRQEKAVENGHISPEQAEQMLALPLSDMTDIMNHFELCDNNDAPIQWDLVLLIVFSQDKDALEDEDDDDKKDETQDETEKEVPDEEAYEEDSDYLEVEVEDEESSKQRRGVRRTFSG